MELISGRLLSGGMRMLCRDGPQGGVSCHFPIVFRSTLMVTTCGPENGYDSISAVNVAARSRGRETARTAERPKAQLYEYPPSRF